MITAVKVRKDAAPQKTHPQVLTISPEQTLTAALAYTPAEFDEVLGLMASGAYPLDGWVESIDLADVLSGGFDAVSQQRATKVLVRP